jgi:type IV pilus assembly protein PilX
MMLKAKFYRLQNPCRHQKGAVLAIGLVMLLLLTLIGISGTQTTGLEERMAGNEQDENLAFQAAEAAITSAEEYLTLIATTPGAITYTQEGINGYYTVDSPVLNDQASGFLSVTQTAAFWENNPTITYSDATLVGVNLDNPPKYFIQFLGQHISRNSNNNNNNNTCVYRIMAYARGRSDNSLAIVESIYAIRANVTNGGCN